MLKRFAQATKQYLERVQNPIPPSEKLLFTFKTEKDLARWSTFSDQEFGGQSEASLALSQTPAETACFSGRYSTEVANPSGTRMKRSGFVGINSVETGEQLDIDEYDHVVFRVKGDGRKYIANLRTENWLVGGRSHDVWQAFLFARKGQWQTVAIPLQHFLLTWKGQLVEQKTEINAKRVISVGVSLAGGDALQPPGNFNLGLEWIKAERRLHGLQEH
ncbi:hypothetical protein WJX77_010736 [Trebouxia sp. C0004]